MGINVLRLSLKVWNWGMGMGGIATILYAILMFRVYGGESSSSSRNITINTSTPWFFHAILFVGIVLCAVTLLGDLAATTANNCCLSIYIVVILLLLILQTVIMAHAFLDPTGPKELPVIDLDDLTDSLVPNDIWKWMASLIFLIQAICVLLAALCIHETDRVDDPESESDEDEEPRLAVLETLPGWQQEDRRIGRDYVV